MKDSLKRLENLAFASKSLNNNESYASYEMGRSHQDILRIQSRESRGMGRDNHICDMAQN